MKIRSAKQKDHDAIWKIFRAVVAIGDTYAIDSHISRKQAFAWWFAPGTHTYVATHGADIVGTYILKANQSGGGAHVANAAFMVALDARGHGVGRAMGEHCLGEAQRFGFRAMQFNFVVSTNKFAISLWKKLGFKVVGTLPGAFRHPTKGDVPVYVMYRSL